MFWELDQFQGPQFLGFVRTIPAPEAFKASLWLPNRTISDIAFEYTKGANDRPVMASVIAYGGEAPMEGRPALGERVGGELPPIKRKSRVDEKEIIRFLTPRAGTPDAQQAIDAIYARTRRMLDAVQARVEWMRVQALSRDQLVYSEDEVTFAFDYGIDEKLQIDITAGTDGEGTDVTATYSFGGVAWDQYATATGLDDISALVDLNEDITGFRPEVFVTSARAVRHLMRQDSTKNLIHGVTTNPQPITFAQLGAYLAANELPTIDTYDVQVASEDGAGDVTNVRPLDQDRGFMLPSSALADVGETLWGPTAESRSLIGTSVASEAPGIFAVVYGNEQPPEEYVLAAATAIPSMPGAELITQVSNLF